MSKSLKKILKKVFTSEVQEQLAVADSKLGSVIKVGTPDIAQFRQSRVRSTIKDKLSISCLHGGAVPELMRCLRSQISNLIAGT